MNELIEVTNIHFLKDAEQVKNDLFSYVIDGKITLYYLSF